MSTQRQPKGIPIGGQFAASAHDEATASLSGPLPRPPARRPNRRPSTISPYRDPQRHIIAGNLNVFDGGPDGALDLGVENVVDGQLSRGIAGRGAVESAREWAQMAEDAGAEEFRQGVEDAVAKLYASHDDPWRAALTKRASIEDREAWQKAVNESPSEAHTRGLMTGGIALAGTEDWWMLRDNPERTIAGA